MAPEEVEMFERDKTRPEDGSATSAFLGKGSRITGKLAFEGTARIEGQVDGEITAQETLTIGEGAVVKARITGGTVIVHGQVTGDITARTRIELRAPGRVVGNVTTPSLVIHEGSVLEGQCAMSGGETARRRKPDFSVLLRGEESEPAPPPVTPDGRK
jgi:cytoskeletal protein CcmA (bactofilin family)